MKCWLDRIIVCYSGSLVISNDLINFEDVSIETKMDDAAILAQNLIIF